MHWVQIDEEFPSHSFCPQLNFRDNSMLLLCQVGKRVMDGMAVNIAIKGLHHDRRLFKSAENRHYITSTLWKNLHNCITNSIQPHIPLVAWCRYSFVKHCTYILLCIFRGKTSLPLGLKWYSTWLSALKDMKRVLTTLDVDHFIIPVHQSSLIFVLGKRMNT